MDNKKLLLVSVSVGLFLVIVIGASILAFSPKKDSAVAAIRAESQNGGVVVPGSGGSFDARDVDISSAPPPVPPATPAAATATETADGTTTLNHPEQPVVVTTIPQTEPKHSSDNIIYIYGDTGETPPRIEHPSDVTAKTYININPKSAAQPNTAGSAAELSYANNPARYPSAPAAKAAPAAKPKAPAKKQAAPAAKPKAAPAKQSAPAAKPKAAPAKQAAPAKEINYWVQTGSFKSKSRADNAKEFLASKGIVSIISNTTVNGEIVYRVRVGPYASKSQADYWLSLIKEIDGMQNSQVWKSSGV